MSSPLYVHGDHSTNLSGICRPELQRRLRADKSLGRISVLGIDPGSVPTSLTRRGNWMIRFMWIFIMPWLSVVLVWLWPNGTYRTAKKSSRDILSAALDSKWSTDSPQGLYLDGEKIIEPSNEAKDARKRAILWADTVRYTGIKEGETVLADWQ